MPNERTKPLFPTYGPEDGTGRDWRAYFDDIRRRGQEPDPEPDPDPDRSDDGGDDLPGAITITTLGHEVEAPSKAGGCPQGLLTWRNRLLANDWQVKVGHAESFHATTYTKKNTVKRPEHSESLWWVNAIRGGVYLTVSYVLIGGKAQSGRTSRTVRGEWRLLGDAELREIVES